MSRKSWIGHISVVVMILACGAPMSVPAGAQAPSGSSQSPRDILKPGVEITIEGSARRDGRRVIGGIKSLTVNEDQKPPSAPPPVPPPVNARPREVELEPISCWSRIDKNVVHIGERFTLTLTCAVVETSRITVVPDPNAFDPAALQLTPFEVLDGTRHEDIQAPPRRYFQYEYTVRLLGEEFFGREIDIPSIKVTYNIRSVSGATEGRDQTYMLPPLPMRILSLVPKNAKDIRDASRETFGDIEARRFRATAELVAAGIFFGFAGVLMGLALVRVVGRRRERASTVVRTLSSGAVLRGCLAAIGRLKSDVAREGWTPEFAGRAVTVFRVAGAIALGRPVAQAIVDPQVPGREGQLVLRKGILRPKRALISAPTTAGAVARQLGNGNGKGRGPSAMAILTEIRDSLQAFSAARYNRNGHFDPEALDAALDSGTNAIRRLRATKLWPMRKAGALAKSAAGLGDTVWSRSENS